MSVVPRGRLVGPSPETTCYAFMRYNALITFLLRCPHAASQLRYQCAGAATKFHQKGASCPMLVHERELYPGDDIALRNLSHCQLRVMRLQVRVEADATTESRLSKAHVGRRDVIWRTGSPARQEENVCRR